MIDEGLPLKDFIRSARKASFPSAGFYPGPNGLPFRLIEKTLYIASSDDKIPRWYAYHLDKTGYVAAEYSWMHSAQDSAA